MSNMEENAAVPSKRVGDSSKKAHPLKVVSPIIKKYSGQRQGRIKKKLEFPRRLSNKKNKNASQVKPTLKTILPKTNAGDVIILESELLPCALNLQTKPSREELGAVERPLLPIEGTCDDKKLKTSCAKDSGIKGNKAKVNLSSKRKKYLKNLEATFALLKPQTEVLKEKREQAFAENYLLRVQQKLKGKDDALYIQFIDLVCDFQKHGMRVIDLYKRVRQLFSGYSDLGEDFIAFLTPQQAVECGVFIEHLLMTTMTDFLNMVDVYFLKSPQQVRKIHTAIEKLSMRQSLTTEDVTNAILPLLKGNTVLEDYFLKLLPDGAPPNNFFTDYEEIEYPELSSDISEDEEHFEIVKVPEVEDIFGGDSCPCNCHSSTDEKFQGRAMHCNSCSVKFINGKIFIQQGKLLRPAKVTFEDFDISYHRDRLVPKHYPSGGRKKTRANVLKENLSPVKSSYHSSDEFKSDIEDDEKIKSKLGLTKSPRAGNRKTTSPKNCDKNVARSILYDAKLDGMDAEEKILGNKFPLEFHWGEDKPCADMDSDPLKNGFGLIDIEPREEFPQPENKPLDLPLIDEEDAMFFNVNAFPVLEREEKIRIESPVFMEKDGSKSPPVLSIPDTANTSMFPSGKPILSFLENLDNSKEAGLLMPDTDAVINFDAFSDMSRNESDVCMMPAPENVCMMPVPEDVCMMPVPEDVCMMPVPEDVCMMPTSENVCVMPETEDVCLMPAPEQVNLEKGIDDSPWKIEEDRIILQTLQVEENCEETFRKINEKIPTRSLSDIKDRFANLMNILYEMKARTGGAVGIN